jgi:transcriptional regulator with XRE-family HTH domain
MNKSTEPVHPVTAALQADDRSQSWLARKIGFSVSQVSRVLSGQRTPNDEFRRKVAELLGKPESELFPEEDER